MRATLQLLPLTSDALHFTLDGQTLVWWMLIKGKLLTLPFKF